jgi:hypothetical protein
MKKENSFLDSKKRIVFTSCEGKDIASEAIIHLGEIFFETPKEFFDLADEDRCFGYEVEVTVRKIPIDNDVNGTTYKYLTRRKKKHTLG